MIRYRQLPALGADYYGFVTSWNQLTDKFTDIIFSVSISHAKIPGLGDFSCQPYQRKLIIELGWDKHTDPVCNIIDIVALPNSRSYVHTSASLHGTNMLISKRQ